MLRFVIFFLTSTCFNFGSDVIRELLIPDVSYTHVTISESGEFRLFFNNPKKSKELLLIGPDDSEQIIRSESGQYFVSPVFLGENVLSFRRKIERDPNKDARDHFELGTTFVDLKNPKRNFDFVKKLTNRNYSITQKLENSLIFGMPNESYIDTLSRELNQSKEDKNGFKIPIFERSRAIPFKLDIENDVIKFYEQLKSEWANRWICDSSENPTLGFSSIRTDNRALLYNGQNIEETTLPQGCIPLNTRKDGTHFAIKRNSVEDYSLIILSSGGREIVETIYEFKGRSKFFETRRIRLSHENLESLGILLHSVKDDSFVWVSDIEDYRKVYKFLTKKYKNYTEFVKNKLISSHVKLHEVSRKGRILTFVVKDPSNASYLYELDLDAKSLKKILHLWTDPKEIPQESLKIDKIPLDKHNVNIPVLKNIYREKSPIIVLFHVKFGSVSLPESGENRPLMTILDHHGYDSVHVTLPGTRGHGEAFFNLGKEGLHGVYEDTFKAVIDDISETYPDRKIVVFSSHLLTPSVLNSAIKNQLPLDGMLLSIPIYDARRSGIHHSWSFFRSIGIDYYNRDEWVGETDNRNSEFSEIEVINKFGAINFPVHNLFLGKDNIGYREFQSYKRRNKNTLSENVLYDKIADAPKGDDLAVLIHKELLNSLEYLLRK
ncbi:MAG: hypothetical protein HRU10_04920 [Opitutales bacterium]|nr:hypothetical protein [Opitutales bacterium]